MVITDGKVKRIDYYWVCWYLTVISSLVPLLEEFDLESPFCGVRRVFDAEACIRRVSLQSGREDVPISSADPGHLKSPEAFDLIQTQPPNEEVLTHTLEKKKD